MTLLPPFHLAIPVHSLEEAKKFYGRILNFQEGRCDDCWIDYNFFGHQLVLHLDNTIQPKSFNAVDKKNVPIPHFGLVLNWKDWILLREKLKILF